VRALSQTALAFQASSALQAAPAFQAALAAWYRANARPLPWRQNPSVYKTVVSEFMLQQTQVKTVLPYFARWLREFPDFAALAAAPPEAVLRAWEGLGYYSRARNLHKLAQAIVALPALPQTPAEWQELPGIGPYTAAAVTSIAFGAPAACVDGNVVRILARLTADATPYRDSGSAAKALNPAAQALMAGCPAPGDHNQAMMELGATICTRYQPQCLLCPVATFCAGTKQGNPETYPALAAKVIERREVVRVWCMRQGALLLHRAAAASRRLAGQYELPTAEQAGVASAVAIEGPLLAKKTRGITRYRITESIHAVRLPGALSAVQEAPADGELVWMPLAELGSVTLSGPHRRWVNELLAVGRG
jgi:A/G-specific adenine glycosylase